MKQSKQFSLNLRDAINGIVVAAGSAVVDALYLALTTVPLHIDYKHIGVTALAAVVAYLGKNYFTKPTEKTAPSK